MGKDNWYYAKLNGMGPALFVCDDSTAGVLSIRKLTNVLVHDQGRGVARISCAKDPGYEANMLQDPIYVPMSAVQFLCELPEGEIKEKLAELWSNLKVGRNAVSDFNRLKGPNGPGPRRFRR